MPFFNRQDELDDIREALASRRSELIIVYGRRGVGKSALLREALCERPHFYYQATTRALPQQLEDLTAALRTFAPDVFLPGLLPSFDAFLDSVQQLARARPEHPFCIVIDELPYLAQADPAIPSVLQRWWDGIRREMLPNLKVFLLGSLMSWMEEQTLSEQGPLHNRRTGQIRLDPLDYANSALFYPDYGSSDRIAAYAIWGGMPSYLEEVNPTHNLWANVRQVVLRPAARLADEPSWLRFADLRKDAIYSSILRAIALAHHRPSRIAKAIGKDRADEIMFHLDRLCDLRLIQRIVPIHEERDQRSKRALYVLADHYLAFWYRYVDRLRHLLGMRRYDDALARIRSDFDKYVSERAFEDICRQFVWRRLAEGNLPPQLTYDSVGSWWVSDEDEQDEIDVIATSEGRAVLVGECKWSRQPADRRDLEGLGTALHRATPALHPIDRPWRAIFSRSGFTDDLARMATDPQERVLLFTPDDLYR